jgi:hypothetical protein
MSPLLRIAFFALMDNSWPGENVSAQTKRAIAVAMQITIGDIGAIVGYGFDNPRRLCLLNPSFVIQGTDLPALTFHKPIPHATSHSNRLSPIRGAYSLVFVVVDEEGKHASQ